MSTDTHLTSLTPGRLIDQLANRIASLRSKLGNVEKHRMGSALTGRKRFLLERVEELERLCADLGWEFKQKVDAKVKILLKPDD